MPYSFSQVPVADIPRSSFNRTHGHKTTFNAGELIPFYVDEALPGDTFKVNVSLFARLATPVVPIMDNLHMDVFFFAVPNRLVWNNWQKMMGEQANPGDSTDYLVPEVFASSAGFPANSLLDYMGVPTLVPNLRVSALWCRAYNLIYNEWFRDENLQNSVAVPKDDGPDNFTDGYYLVRKRGKRHDYFTSCLPWPQKGAGVDLPIAGFANVIPRDSASAPTFRVQGGSAGVAVTGQNNGASTGMNMVVPGSDDPGKVIYWNNDTPMDTGLMADLSTTSAVSINSMRQAFQIQRLLERDARGGTRYTEILRSHFGVVSPDARLQRPEYLGGGSVPIQVNPVMQTSGTPANPSGDPTGGATPQGNLAAYGVVGANNMGYTKSFVEHCVIIGLVMVRADLSYMQGLNRMWSRRSRFDFYWPAFSHLGEQAVLNREIYADGTGSPGSLPGQPGLGASPGTGDYGVFGYQERWAEYRYFPSKITGAFRANYPDGSLDFWHLAEKFETRPALNAAFIEDPAGTTVKRVIAVQSEPQFLFDSHIRIVAVRPMPTYSVPGLIDHF